MKINTAEFIISNSEVDKCPKDFLPEYAFIGRSNVGKSSLINMLTNHKNLAKTSVVQKAWEKRALSIHGWVYGFNNGIITDLNCMINELNDLEPIFRFKISDNSF